MKKTLSLVLALLMVVAVVFTGCAGESAGEGKNANNKEETVDKIVLATGGNTGTYYGYGMAMSTVLADETGIAFDVQPTGASKANIQLIQLGDADMAVVQNDVMYYAYTGTDLFTGEQTQDFQAMAVLYPELCQIIASKDSGIKTVADLAGKRVSVGDAGSGVEFNAKQILAAYGIDINSGIQKQNLGFGPSADALKDGKIDAFFCVAGIPTTAITDLAMNNAIEIVEVEDDKYEALAAQYGFYTQQIIPAGTYKGVDEDKKTVAVMATYIVDKDLPEKAVYDITKAMFENKDAIAAAHAKGLELDVTKATAGIPDEVPVHPGAAKYYAEVAASVAAE
ncbi:MAG: TAXI family TRAP transporter solute-binding subunit [Clostridia bacterium]|nr:TAXI family TRAP transporter solute-binding subunit [Clostridia bacterium]MBQ8758762.1 TAXI family TRAP transporter solute-binding subunit [Clostridia bacterium]